MDTKRRIIRFIIMIMMAAMFESNTGEIIHKCDFELDMCGWTSGDNDTFKWNRTESSNKANSVVDLTTREGEHCLYMSSENHNGSLFVNLTSPTFKITGEACLSLWYYTSDVLKRADLFVFKYNTTVYHEFDLKKISKSTSGGWKREQVNIISTDEYKISMTALSDSANNVIAVDDITITTGSCPQEYTPDGYIGCFEDIPLEHKLRNSETNNGEECRLRCKSKAFKYAGTKQSHECHCGSNIINNFTDEALCNMTCPGNEQESCGGNHSMSLYNTFTEVTTKEKETFHRKVLYILIGAGVGSVLVIFIIVFIIRRRKGKSRKTKTSLKTHDLTNAMSNEYIPEPSIVVLREEDASKTYNYISLDTINDPVTEEDNAHLTKWTALSREHGDGVNTYHSITLDTLNEAAVGKDNANLTKQTGPFHAYSHVSPTFKMKGCNVYDHIQDITVVSGASGEIENKTTHFNDTKQNGDQSGTSDERWYDKITSNKSNKQKNKPDDDYSHLNHNKRMTESLFHTASDDSEHNDAENKYEHFVERKPDVYLDIKPNTTGRLYTSKKEDDKDKFKIVDEKETNDFHMYYTLEKH